MYFCPFAFPRLLLSHYTKAQWCFYSLVSVAPLRSWIQFQGCETFEVIFFFHSWFMEGHFSPLKSQHTRCLMKPGMLWDASYEELYIAEWAAVLCAGQWRGFVVSKGVPCLWEPNKPSVTQAPWFTVWEGASGTRKRGNGPLKAPSVFVFQRWTRSTG